jgi:hypothetical protein
MIFTLACRGADTAPKKQEVVVVTPQSPQDAAAPVQHVSDKLSWLEAYKNKGDEPIEKLSIIEGDGAYAAMVVDRYLHAVAVEDWKIVCEQRMPTERAELAEGVGSCEEAYRRMLEGQSSATLEVFMVLHAEAARRRGKLIAIDADSPARPDRKTNREPFMTLLLGREGDSWYLIDLPKSQDF